MGLVPDDMIKSIVEVMPPSPEREDDRISWKPCKDGVFTNRSAYEGLLDQSLEESTMLSKLLWS